MTNVSLILEGGGMRGLYTAGVLDCFLDHGIAFPAIYAVSAGACHACSYLSGQRGRAARTVLDYRGDRRYGSLYSLLTTGDYIGAKFTYDQVPNHLLPFDYDAFRANETTLYAVLTSCKTGKPVYRAVRDLKTDMPLIQASSSLPLLSRMVQIGGESYLDGGISDSIPLSQAKADGCGRHVVILTQHDGYTKGPNRLLPLIKLRYRGYPALVEQIGRRHAHYNAALSQIRRDQAAGTVFVIRPKTPVSIGRLEKDTEKLKSLYEAGYADTQEAMDNLRTFLEAPQT